MDIYYTSCIPEPFTICKRKLRPFSIGHQIILKRFENAFVTSKDKILWHDLAHAVLICSQDYHSAIHSLDSAFGIWKYKRILNAIKRDFGHKCELMLDYIERGKKAPENITWKDGEASYASPEAMLKHVMMAKLGYSEDRALNMPYSQAIYEFCVWQQSEGYATFLDPSEDVQKVDLQKEADEFDAMVKQQREES